MPTPIKPLTVCVINLKGGVGKSTITALLSRHAFNRGNDVLAIDLDPQANLSQGLLHRAYSNFLAEHRGSIVEVFQDYISPKKGSGGAQPLTADDVTETILERDGRTLDLIASRFDFSDALTDAVRPDPKVLARFLSKNFKSKDLILIDCAPTESVFTLAAYHASDFVLIPVKPEFFATIGFPLLAESLSNFKRKNKASDIEVAGVVINNAFYHGGNDGGPEKQRAMGEIRRECQKNGWHIFGRQMYHSRGYPKLMRGDYSHSGDAGYFWLFADEFLKHIGL